MSEATYVIRMDTERAEAARDALLQVGVKLDPVGE